MQLSAANLIIASQQLARGAAKPAGDGAQFAQALAKEQGAKETDAFEALDFKKAAAAKPAMAASAPAPATGYGAARSLGGNIDIVV
ncbi:MAG: hypothetical protein ISS15_07360 [Alphaproteobacteria bacterium]|nr:hypothetical protein [Alphaproteobacteria bacterium]MBL6936688.1 hypothetical protein [Alphaproteobacteria bacterium]MBL7097457.1 hypothetical protein [Alphaproteobacteria bacterium]